MKKASLVLKIGAILFAVYAIVMLVFNIVSYASYVSYYGAGSVVMAVLEGFFSPAGWAFLLFGISALLSYLANKPCPADKPIVNDEAIDLDELLGAEEDAQPEIETAQNVETEVASSSKADA